MRRLFNAALLLLAFLILAAPFSVVAASPRFLLSPPGAAPAAALLEPQPPPDLSELAGLMDTAAIVADLLTANIGGIPVFLIVLLVVLAAEFGGLTEAKQDPAREQMNKQRLALGTGISFGLLASVLIISPDPALVGWQLAAAVITGVVRGLLAGILAALTYETGRALLNRARGV